MLQVLIELLFFRWLTIHRWNNKINKEFLIKRVLFSVFSKLALSDINSWTLKYINKVDSTIFENLQNKVFENIFTLNWPDFIKSDMKDVLNDTSHKLELKIIDAARNYSGLQECIINSKVFPDVYDIPTKEIQLELTLLKQDLDSLEILMDSDKYKTYLSQIRRLSHSQRWPWEQRKYNITVMAHLLLKRKWWMIFSLYM